MTVEPLQHYNIDDFAIMSDEDIVALANDGHTLAQEFLIDKYKNFVRAKARSYFLIGADKEDITGYNYEPWHVRYLGKETAEKVYESGLCLEEYLGAVE